MGGDAQQAPFVAVVSGMQVSGRQWRGSPREAYVPVEKQGHFPWLAEILRG